MGGIIIKKWLFASLPWAEKPFDFFIGFHHRPAAVAAGADLRHQGKTSTLACTQVI